MPHIYAIDPGPINSAIVAWDGKSIGVSDIVPNEKLIQDFRHVSISVKPSPRYYIEQVRGFGLPASNQLFDTCHWTGRFQEALECSDKNVTLVPRKEVKMHLCGNNSAKDADVRKALLYRFGEPGTKKAPGVTYGLARDLWAAFALAVYAVDVATGLSTLQRAPDWVGNLIHEGMAG